MPKKIDKKKKPVKPKSKPKRASPDGRFAKKQVRASSTKPKKPISQITYQKLPKEGCCTDVLKTGQAYTIPFGFKDRLGTQRIGEPDEPVARRLNEVVKPKMVDAGVGTRVPSETSISTVPAYSLIPRIRKPTMRQELEDRYERATGSKYKGKRLNNSELLFVVEQAERRQSGKKI